MSDIKETIRHVEAFLKGNGFDSAQAQLNTQDGHWMLQWCQTALIQGVCLGGVDEVCRQLFTRLESGSVYQGRSPQETRVPWTRENTNEALLAGGFRAW